MATIPEQLPMIMKDFSKAVLKEQPEDIIAFAALLGEEWAFRDSFNPYERLYENPHTFLCPFIAIAGKISSELLKRLRVLLQEMPTGNISPNDFVNACRKLRIQQNVIDLLLSLSDDELIPWEQVLVQSTTFVHDNFLPAMKTVFDIFADESGRISCSNLLSLFHFLSSAPKMSPQVSEEVGNSISEWLLNRSMDAETEEITWSDFASFSPVAENFQ